ncbi:CPBP family intramembrane metalloprotease, partial [Lactobacillus sp. XV13L]|nr:CPBP family intramembrane metalloprotease [Lactobacillus sp. XV13L]
MKKVFYFLGNIGALVLAFLMYGLVQGFYFYPLKVEQVLHLGAVPYTFLVVAVTAFALFLLFVIYRKQLDKGNDWNFNARPHWSVRRLLIALLGFVLLVAASAATQALLKLGSNATSTNEAALNDISRQAGVFFPPMVALVAPLFEETIFRGLLFNTFFAQKTTLSKWLGILVSGFVFGYVHDPDLTKFLFVYWALGCVLAWVYTTTKDLRYSVIAHIPV